eukprot:bmy_02420T0
MNPPTHAIPPHQHKSRGVIHASNIKSSRILYPMIWMGLQLKVCTNWDPTSSSTNSLIRSNTGNHPLITETNRAPFDLTEGESELVSSFSVEYAAGPFAIFFLAEYANISIINMFTTILFLGAFHNPYTPELYTINFTVKTLLLTLPASNTSPMHMTCITTDHNGKHPPTNINIINSNNSSPSHKTRTVPFSLLSARSNTRHPINSRCNSIDMTKTCTPINPLSNLTIN